MKLTIIAVGSRGDVQPMVALGLGLQEAGHEVRIAADLNFENFVRQHSLNYVPVRFDMKRIFGSEQGKKGLNSGKNAVKSAQSFAEIVNPMIMELGEDTIKACQGSDAVIHSLLGFYFASTVYETLKLPTLMTFLQPNYPTKDFPAFLFPIQRNLGALSNRFSYLFQDAALWLSHRQAINDWRRQSLNLNNLGYKHFAEARTLKFPIIYGFSPQVIPKPKDWNDNIHVSGYWFLEDKTWQPPQGLLDFLAAGDKPLCVSFGSMMCSQPDEIADMFIKALAKTGQRGVFLTGWGGLSLSDLPENVYALEAAPHSWLFPRMAAVVHHGGAGTTAAGLRAGVPTITVPFFFDQFFWGKRVADLGVGPKPIPHKNMKLSQVCDAISQVVTDQTFKQKATRLGQQIKTESGVTNAVNLIQQHLTTL